MGKIKVILSHPRVIFREGIHFILSGEEDFEVAGETTDNSKAFDLIKANPPDVAILWQHDEKVSGAEITRRIKRNYPSVAVVLITDSNDAEQLFLAMASGTSAILTPDTDPENLVAVIRDAARGHFPVVEALLMPALVARTLTDFQDMATLNERLGIYMAQLSKKEAETLSTIVSGGEIGQVAAKLNISEEAIRDQLRNILQNLTANDRNRTVIAEAQRNLPAVMPGRSKGRGQSREYLTRAEFDDFKNFLAAGFKSLVSGKL